ncbi:hypothetical protein [Umezawaea sp. Da 62-37]|uniref:hypothetical protein n=1 Tax=Umezawaea sp. Da 62-37 TaxID=3075927 RepID=UPI0028F6F2AC|nr:hypothetical protein [Umezawaea sp. Da 62-37]WNV89667.1 hypothetical protein RM788_15595 [Umezawaea sp. Da 62-37]
MPFPTSEVHADKSIAEHRFGGTTRAEPLARGAFRLSLAPVDDTPTWFRAPDGGFAWFEPYRRAS